MDDVLAQFTSITSADPERASQYLRVTDYNLEQAIQLYFESDGVDMGGSAGPMQPHSGVSPSREHAAPIPVDSDEEPGSAIGTQHRVEDDEAIARRLQDEMYGSAGPGPGNTDPEGVRAPIGRTTETLLGPSADWRDDPEEMNAAIAEQMMARQQRRCELPHPFAIVSRADPTNDPVQRPGIFNQETPTGPSIWENGNENPELRRRNLARATGGASETSSKTSMLAEMYRPPFELISPLRSWEGVRAAGKEEKKWILINIQDPNIFDCQVLNRDIWKDTQIHETVKENFIFKQYNKSDPQAASYVRFYFHTVDSEDAYPHIAIVDPRTGEQVKVWSGTPAPKAPDFLMQLHEFLDRYSLNAFSKNPVATRKAEQKRLHDPEKMTEEEQMEMALQYSLGSKSGSKVDDPDVLTKSEIMGKGKGKAAPPPAVVQGLAMSDETQDAPDPQDGVTANPVASISLASPHFEPAQSAPNTTRIQFRHPGGRIVRRFEVSDPVRRIYEWLKADPLEGKAGVPFELVFMGKNLIEVVDTSIEEAGLKNGSVMVEFTEG